MVPIPDESAPWCTLWVMSHGEARSRVTMMFNQSRLCGISRAGDQDVMVEMKVSPEAAALERIAGAAWEVRPRQLRWKSILIRLGRSQC